MSEVLSSKALAAQLHRAEHARLIGPDGRPVARGILAVLDWMHGAVTAGGIATCGHVDLNATSIDESAWWHPDVPQAICCAGCHDRVAATTRPDVRCTGCEQVRPDKAKVMHLVPGADGWPPVMILSLLCETCRRPPRPSSPKRKKRRR